jgi:hypothetical protein
MLKCIKTATNIPSKLITSLKIFLTNMGHLNDTTYFGHFPSSIG